MGEDPMTGNWPSLDLLHDKAVELSKFLKVHAELFRGDARLIGLMNETAGESFYFIERAMSFNIASHLAAMLDPPKTKRQVTVSVQMLLDEAEHRIESGVWQRLRRRWESVASERCRVCTFRHKHVAQSDQALRVGDAHLEGPSWDDIDRAADVLYSILSVLREHEYGAEFGYDRPLMSAPQDLVACLEESAWIRHLQRGIDDDEISLDDLEDVLCGGGLRGGGWYLWCERKQQDARAHLPRQRAGGNTASSPRRREAGIAETNPSARAGAR